MLHFTLSALPLLMGCGVMVYGLILWKKQKITWIHSYHRRYVRTEDIPALTKAVGSGSIIIGFGILFFGAILMLSSSMWGFAGYLIALPVGVIRMVRAVNRYNVP